MKRFGSLCFVSVLLAGVAPAFGAQGGTHGPPTTPPGNSGSNPQGGPPGITGSTPAPQSTPPTPPPASGPPTTPPGNSGSNPQGGPPGITGSTPASNASPPSPPVPSAAGTPSTAGTPQGPPVDPGNPNGNGGTHTNNGEPHQRITICHATGSSTNPYVRITISVNGLHGHGHHGDDIIPAPDQGCAAAAAEQQQGDGGAGQNHGPKGNVAGVGGGGGIDGTGTPHVKGETGSGGTVDTAAPADAGPSADSPDGGSLPFTGLDVGVLIAAAASLLALGLYLRRRTAGQNL